MRRKDNYPKVGDTKIIERFAFLPIWIDGETRWLEKVKYKIEYQERVRASRFGQLMFPGWVKIEFIN